MGSWVLAVPLQDMRVVFADGTVLDTADEASRASFLRVSERRGGMQLFNLPSYFRRCQRMLLF
jgi:hypothetical protein